MTLEEKRIVLSAAKTIIDSFELTGLNPVTINAVMDQVRILMQEKLSNLYNEPVERGAGDDYPIIPQ